MKRAVIILLVIISLLCCAVLAATIWPTWEDNDDSISDSVYSQDNWGEIILSNGNPYEEILLIEGKTGESFPVPMCSYDDFIGFHDKAAIGYRFKYWRASDGGTYLPGASIIIPNGTTILQAHFEPVYQHFEVVFSFTTNAEDCAGNMNDITVKSGDTFTIPECKFTRNGWSFGGWIDGIHTYAYYMPGEQYTVPFENVVFTAVWEPATMINNEPVKPSNPDAPSKATDLSTSPYTDISNHWANDIIQYIDKLGLIDRATATTFAPDKPMTREVFVTAMARLAGVESDYINWAIEIGLLKGYGDGEYGLNDTITREQMAVFFLRFLELTDVDYEACKTVAPYKFTDDAKIADWAKDAVYEMQALDLIHGKGNGIFDPKGLTTRAEGATVLYNMCKTVLKK